MRRQKSTPLLLVDYSKSRAKTTEPVTLASSVSLQTTGLTRSRSGAQLFPRTTGRPLRRQLSTDMLDSAILVTNRLLDLPMNNPLEDTHEVLSKALQFASQEVEDLEDLIPSVIAAEPETSLSPPATASEEPEEVRRAKEHQPAPSLSKKKTSSTTRTSWELNESLLNLDTSLVCDSSESDSENSLEEDSDSDSEEEESQCGYCDVDDVSHLSQDSASVLQEASVSSFCYGDDDTTTARETVTSTGDSDSVSFRVRKVSMHTKCQKRNSDSDAVPSAVVRLEQSLSSILGGAPGMPHGGLLGGSSMKDESEQDLLLPVSVMNEKVPTRRILLNDPDYQRESARSLIHSMQENRRSSSFKKIATEDIHHESPLNKSLSKLKKLNRRSKSRTKLGMERTASSSGLESQRTNRSRIRRTNSSQSMTKITGTRPFLSMSSPLERTHGERCLMSPESNSGVSPMTDDSRRTNRRLKNRPVNRRSSLDSSSASNNGNERRASGRKVIRRTKSKDFSASLIGSSLQYHQRQPNHAYPYGDAMNDASCNSHFDQDQTSGESLRSTLARLKKLTQKPQQSSRSNASIPKNV